MKDSEGVVRIGAASVAEYAAMPAGSGGFMSVEAVALRTRDITAKEASRIGRNHLPELNDALGALDPGLSVTHRRRLFGAGSRFWSGASPRCGRRDSHTRRLYTLVRRVR